MTTPPDSSLLQLQYRPDLGLLAVRWLRDADSLAEAQAACQAVLAAAQAEATGRLLMDRRRITPAMPGSEWMVHEWLPTLSRVLPGPVRIASLASPELWQAVTSQTPLRAAADEVLRPGHPYQVGVFMDEGAAVQWLQS